MPSATFVTFSAGGGQYRAKAGDTIVVNRMPQPVGETVALGSALLVEQADGGVKVGEEANRQAVSAVVVEHFRGEKLRVFKMRRRKSSRTTGGHRQELTKLRVDSLD